MKKMTYAKLLSVTLFASVALIVILASGKAAAASFCGCGLLSQVNASNSDANCEDENNASCDGSYPGHTIANNYGSMTLESASNEATIKSNFVKNLQWFAGQHPYQQISAAWIESRLGGSDWAARINSSAVTLKLENYSFGENTMYMPADNGGSPSTTSGSTQVYAENGSALAVVIYVNGVVYDAVKVDCGNMVGSMKPLPPPNSPPTGSFVSATCVAASEDYVFKVNYSDPDGSTTGELKGSGGTVYTSSGGTSATWTISTKTITPGNFPVGLWVKDVGPAGDQQFHQVATQGLPNCNPVGSIATVGGACDEVSFSLYDPNDPTDNINYYLKINGTNDGAYTFAKGQSGTASNVHLYNYAGFDQWSPSNSVTLVGVDNQTHGQVSLNTATFSGSPCATPVCGSSTVAGQTYGAGQAANVQVWMNISSTAGGLPTYGPKSSDFSSIVFETLNETNYPESYSSGKLYSTPSITYRPPGFYNNTINYAFYDGENHTTYPCTTTAPTKVVYEPYYTVVGGDISAGQGFEAAGGGGCTEATADIAGYNAGASNQYFGAGTRQGAIATGNIDQFATDMTNVDYTNSLGGSTDGLSAHMPSGLAFPNVGMAAGMYGGGFMKSSPQQWCVPNYYSSYTATASTAVHQLAALPASWSSLAANTSYVIQLSGNATITSGSANPITIPVGTHVTILDSAGSVYIKSDIKYAGFSNQPTLAQTLADIPQFNLLMNSGNIFIDPGVDELHGLYVAQPGGANTGQFVTCGNGYSYPGNVIKDYTTCSPPAATALTVYGAVSAAQIVPGRTLGNIIGTSAITNDPAEQYVYTPELWLGETAGPSTSCATNQDQPACAYQSYTSLPPVL